MADTMTKVQNAEGRLLNEIDRHIGLGVSQAISELISAVREEERQKIAFASPCVSIDNGTKEWCWVYQVPRWILDHKENITAIVRCRMCAYGRIDKDNGYTGEYFCELLNKYMGGNEFCSFGREEER